MIFIVDLSDLLPLRDHFEGECVSTYAHSGEWDSFEVDFYYDGDLICSYVMSLR